VGDSSEFLGKFRSFLALTSFRRCLRSRVHRVERKSSLARNVKLADRQRVHLLHPLVLVRASLELLQTLGNVESDVDENAINLRLHFVCSEEDVGFEVVNRLVDDKPRRRREKLEMKSLISLSDKN
jgi:hypothetical protein